MMIPKNAKTALIRKPKGEIEAVALTLRNGQPCRYFSRYQGVRSPVCGCFPCMERYLHRQSDLGRHIEFSSYTMQQLFETTSARLYYQRY